MSVKISFFTCVRNDKENLKGVLENVKGVVDEIVVIDDESTDGSYELAKELGAKVYRKKPSGFVEPNRIYAINKVTHEWILYLDVDERLCDKLKYELRNIVETAPNNVSGIAVSVRYYISPRRYIRCYKDLYPNFRLRIVRKGKVLFTNTIHADPLPLGEVIYLDPKKYFIKHLAFKHYNLNAKSMSKHVKYAKIASNQRKGKKMSDIFLAFSSPVLIPLRLFKDLILKGALLEGIIGLKISLIHVTYLTLIDIFKALG